MRTGVVLSSAAEDWRLRFQEALDSDLRPSIGAFVKDADVADRDQLLCALVEADWRSRQARGERPTVHEYCELFPAAHEMLRSFLAALQDSADNSLGSTVSLVEVSVSTPGDVSATAPARRRLGRYRLEEELGRGGFGVVWRARDPDLNRQVAIKVLRGDREGNAAAAQMLLDEARKVARFNHPAILRIYDVAREDDCVYIVSEWMPQGTLAQHLSAYEGRPDEAAALVIKIAEGLHYAHLRGVVHRDVKPANILLDEHLQPRVADFGLAVTEDEQLREERATRGTYAFMPPELARGDSQFADPRSDIYSLGVVLYRLLTRRYPFVAHTPEQWIEQILDREPRPPRTINDRIPPELERICLKCLAKNVAERYTSARDLADELARYLATAKNAMKRTFIQRTAIAAAAFFLVVGLALYSFNRGGDLPVAPANGSGSPSSTGSDSRSEPAKPTEAIAEFEAYPPVPDQWVSALRQSPLKLIWSTDPVKTSFNYDQENRSLQAMCPVHGLLELGETTRPSLSLGAVLYQPSWEGRIGLFFGYQLDTEKGPGRHSFQTVTLERKIEKGTGHLLIYRNYYEGDEAGFIHAERHVVASKPLVAPSEAQMLELKIDGKQVSVRWADHQGEAQPVDAFSDLSVADYQGKFGLYLLQSSGVFRNVRVMYPSEQKAPHERPLERQQDSP